MEAFGALSRAIGVLSVAIEFVGFERPLCTHPDFDRVRYRRPRDKRGRYTGGLVRVPTLREQSITHEFTAYLTGEHRLTVTLFGAACEFSKDSVRVAT
jgi:hypothetical protein